jgi:methyl-accepting chemotaxis protein
VEEAAAAAASMQTQADSLAQLVSVFTISAINGNPALPQARRTIDITPKEPRLS